MTNNHFTQPFGMVKGLIDFACLAMVTILSALFNQAGARTITAPDKVVYEITSETAHTARVSIENQSIHRENASPVTILSEVTDPDNGQTYTVTEIVENAFRATAITAIDIQAGITSIPSNTFRDCPNLETVVFPQTLKGIGGNCFMDSHKLKTPRFPEGLTTIGGNAFCGTYMGEELVLPSGVSVIMYAFASTTIPSIRFPEENNGFKLYGYSFPDVKELKSLVFPAWMTQIPDGAFKGCEDLEYVDCSNITSEDFVIGQNAFFQCRNLSKVVFPDKMKEIGIAAFSQTAISELRLPELETLGAASFNCTQIKKMTADCWPSTPIKNVGTSMFYATPLTEITFPDWLTEIPGDFCRACGNLSKVDIPEGVVSIGTYAFFQTALTSLELPSSIRKIGEASFSRSKLATINLPEGLETIESNAFNGCALTEITIPSSIKSIGEKAFYSNKLSKINLPGQDDPDFTPFEFGAYVFASNPIFSYTCPAWMTIVPEGFMQACWLTSLTFAPGVEEIRNEAFADNNNLQVGTLPESIKVYWDRSFKACGSLLPQNQYFATIYIGNGVQIASEAFRQARIKEVIFTDCQYNLGENIFLDVTSVKRIAFPDCMTAIPDGICNGWSELTEVVWPPRVESIGDQAFKGCTKLIFGTDDNGDGNIVDFTKAPFDNLTDVGDEAFANTLLTDVVWPASGDSFHIGDNLFSGIRTLTSAHIPGWMQSVPDGLFMNCRNLTDLIWDDSDRESLEIGPNAFRGLGIPAIEWPDVPTAMGEYAFADNDNATTINWNDSPATLSTGTFYECDILSSPVSLPEYITSVPASCFANCKSLPEFTLHEGITSVGDYAFEKCTAMKEFTMLCNISVIPNGCFSGCVSLERFHAAYPVTVISYASFENCSSLFDFDLNNGDSKLTSIDAYAFRNCKSLVEFPDIITGQTKVLDSTFNSCEKLRHIVLPSTLSVRLSDGFHFQNATSLQAVDFRLTTPNKHLTVFPTSFDNAPLLGVSYAAFDLDYNNIDITYAANARSEKGILMVNRDQKYKLMEKGYGDIWDIREIKSPQLKLYGDIHSEFTPGGLRNHYKTMIRWEIVESDLREDAPTVYHLCRDGKEIARIEVSTLKVLDSVNDGNVNRNEPTNSYAVKITRDGVEMDMSEQYGDFDYEFEPGGYIMVYSNQQKNLYFNPETSHRIGLNEKMGINSWFLFVDEFDSPDLNEPGVPDRYTYTLAMDGYPYREPVNNEGYLPGEDGLYWHYEDRVLDRVESEPCVVHTAMAVPSIDIYGLYSLADIQADTDGKLPVSKDVMSDGVDVRLSYEFSDPEQVGHYLFEHPIHYPIIQNITCFELPSRNNPEVYSELQSRDINGNTSLASGNIPVPADHNPTIGASYQIVTNTLCRGTFGSRIVTIPGVPDLNADMDNLKLCFATPEHNHEPVFRANIHLYPDVDMMGYYELPDDSQHSIGVWRGIGRQFNAIDMMADGATGEEELIYHLGDDRSFHSWSCTDCREHQKYDTADGQWSYTDHFATGNIPVGQLLDIKADYRVRLYVQTVDDPSKWMIAEVHTSRSELISGVEDVIADPSGTPVYYNLQGIKVESPRPGEVLIRVDRSGSQKVIFE